MNFKLWHNSVPNIIKCRWIKQTSNINHDCF